MTKKECIKKYDVQKILQSSEQNSCIKGKDLRNYEHPYHRDNSKYIKLNFILQFTSFEYGEYGYGCYLYNSRKMNYEEAKTAYDELETDWTRPGRKAWNSMNLIGFDETGKSFSAM